MKDKNENGDVGARQFVEEDLTIHKQQNVPETNWIMNTEIGEQNRTNRSVRAHVEEELLPMEAFDIC